MIPVFRIISARFLHRQVEADDAERTGRGDGDGDILPVAALQSERDGVRFALYTARQPVQTGFTGGSFDAEFHRTGSAVAGGIESEEAVVAQVEKQIAMSAILAAVKDADEFPIATMNGNRRREPVRDGRVVGEVLKHRIAGERAPRERGQDADAVKLLPRRGRKAKTVKQGGIEVLALDECVGAGARLGDARPVEDQGHARAAFINGGLASA